MFLFPYWIIFPCIDILFVCLYTSDTPVTSVSIITWLFMSLIWLYLVPWPNPHVGNVIKIIFGLCHFSCRYLLSTLHWNAMLISWYDTLDIFPFTVNTHPIISLVVWKCYTILLILFPVLLPGTILYLSVHGVWSRSFCRSCCFIWK